MISTDEMSSTSMDISETFRPEDLSKTDFFDFVSATEMGIGVGISNIGVGISLQAQQHQYHDQLHQQQPQNHERLSASSNMTHDGGGTAVGSINDVGSNSIRNGTTSDPTLPNYEFWNSDKDASRLDSSIFEDLDRYCWQQQQQQQQQTTTTSAQAHHTPANQTTNNPTHTDGTALTGSALNCDSSATNNNNHSTRTTHSAGGNSNISQTNSSSNALNATSVHNSDSQIYTITVLNGGNDTTTSNAAASWLKREPEETQIPTSLDLESLLGNFSGYIKSEYPYDDSGFSTDGAKEAINGDANGISIQQQQQHQGDASTMHTMSSMSGGGGGGGSGSGQTLPPLVTAMSVGGRACVNIGQQLAAQFQNNNNDWHMIDHNAEHNSAESLLRSALQGKGYTKGLHHMHNGGISLLPASPSNKDDEMRRIIFSNEADSLAFADSTLNTAQIFEESQHHTNLLQLHSNASATGTSSNGPMSQAGHSNNGSSLMVDDMFLTLENAFSDDFDKMKRIANEVQQYCNTPPVENDYISNDIMMQISPTPGSVGSTTAQQLQPLHSPVTTSSPKMVNIVPPPTSPLAAVKATHHLQQQQQQQQRLKPEVSIVTTTTTTAAAAPPSTNSRSNATKATKKYKRVSNTTNNTNNNNNNNNNSLNAVNNNNNIHNNNSNSNSLNNNNNNATCTKNLSSNNNNNNNSSKNNNNTTPPSVGSSSSSSNSPPTAHCNGQRKERSLHYCSICSKGFKDKYSVNVHIRTHTGEKPFACSLCGKSFRQKAHLAKHYQTHMAQKNNHGTGIMKSNSSKHHRASSTAVASNSVSNQQRQLSMISAGSSMPSQINVNPGTCTGGGNNIGLGINPNLLGVTSTVVTLNGPTNSVGLATNVLPPPNSLLANR